MADFAYSVFSRNKQKMDIYFHHLLTGTQYFTKCLPVIVLYKAQLNAIIVDRKYTLLGRLVNFK
jgi:hypothetical protein